MTPPDAVVTTYTYDRAPRLINVTNAATTITSHACSLDSPCNRTALVDDLAAGRHRCESAEC